jgi:hypothetical protein
MAKQKKNSPNLVGESSPTRKKHRKTRKNVLIFVTLLLTFCAIAALIQQRKTLQQAAAQPVDAILVLGGSIKREMYVTKLAKQHPDIPILISQGSAAPCVWLLFERDNAPMQGVWLEQCATSTFANFKFACPILEQWDARHVKVITSPRHLPRAKWLAQIILGVKGIWVEMELVEEEGVPGNREFWLKTLVDVTRSALWAIAAQFYTPHCAKVQPLTAVDMEQWEREGFQCEHQAGL